MFTMEEPVFESVTSMDADQFEQWVFERNAWDVHHYELLHGRIVVTPPAGFPHGRIEAKLLARLVTAAELVGAQAFGSSQGYVFPSGDVLPDLFTTSSVFDAGGYESLGYMAAVTQNLGDNLKVNVMYGSGDALVADRSQISGQSPDDLRSVIRRGRRQAVTTQVFCKAPWTGTEFSASYQITDSRSVTPSHYFATQGTRAEPGLNIYVRQPIRTFSLIPVHMEASADLRNLLADGYLPFSAGDGRRGTADAGDSVQ